jgi:peptide/nickel transport system ATP-binding protein
MILRRGRIVEIGPTEKVFSDPRHPYTKTLVASVPQLHRRWEAAPLEVAGGGDGSAALVDVGGGHLVALSP